jgi:hypothetical protein
MRVLVCGSREWCDKSGVCFILNSIQEEHSSAEIFSSFRETPLVIIQGECRGPDTYAKEWAQERSIECLSFPADWSQGKRAGPERNKKMLQEGKPDLVLAFTDDLETSRGTRSMVTLAREAGIWTCLFSQVDIASLRRASGL